jgi:fibronectin-binding autotransporter adhesin
MLSNRIRSRLMFSSAVLGFPLLWSSVQGASFTWDAEGAGDTNWGTAANWSPTSGGSVPAVGDDVEFATAGSAAVINTTSRTVGSILLNRGGVFTISASGGAALTVNTGASVTGSAAYGIAAPVALGSTGTWNVGTSGTLDISGVVSGAFGLRKTGPGTLVLADSNTYTGTLSINGGTVVINKVANWGSASSLGHGSNEGDSEVPFGPFLSLNNGALRYVGTLSTSTNRTFAMGTLGATIDASGIGSLTFSNWKIVHSDGTNGARTLTLTGTSTVANTLGLVLVDHGGPTSLTKTGSGKWVIPAGGVPGQPPTVGFVNQYSGSTKILGGTLEVRGDNTDGKRQAGIAIGDANSGIGKSSNDEENLVIDGGTLRYVYVGNKDPGNDPPSTADPNWYAHDAGQVDRYFTVGEGGGTLDVSTESSGQGGPLHFYSKGIVTMPGTASRTLTLTGTFADPTEGTNQYNAIAAVIGNPPAGGVTTVVKEGSGEWVLNGRNEYTGGTVINAGTLLLAHGYGTMGGSGDPSLGVLPSGGTVSIASGATLEFYTGDEGVGRHNEEHVQEHLVQRVASISGSGTIDLNSGTLEINNTSTGTFSGVIIENTDGNPFDFDQDKQTSGNLTKMNSGTLVLTGTSRYTGVTTVSAGTLLLSGGADRLPPATSLVITSGTLNLNGNAQTVASLSGSGGGVVLGSGTLTVGGSTDGSFAGVISGTGSLIRKGSGTLTLTAANTYSGGTTVNGGTLLLSGNGAATSSSGFAVQTGGVLKLDNGGTVSDDRIGTVDVTLSGGTLNYKGAAHSSAPSRSDESISRLVLPSGESTLTVAESTGSDTDASLTFTHGTSGVSRSTGATLQYLEDGEASVIMNNLADNDGVAGGWVRYGQKDFATLTGTTSGTITTATVDSSNINTAGATDNVQVASTFSTSSTRTINSLGIVGTNSFSSTISSGNGVIIDSGGLILNGGDASSDKTLAGPGTLTAGAGGSYELIVHATENGTHTISAPIVNNGGTAVALTKAGAVTLVLTANNTYTGATYVSAGTLSVGTLANGGTSSGIGSSSNAAGNLVLNGGVLRWTGSTGQTSDRNYTLASAGGGFDASGSGSSTLTISGNMTASGTGNRTFTLSGDNTGTNTLSGTISDASGTSLTSLSKSGAGRWVLTGSNAYTGGTTVNAGTLHAEKMSNGTLTIAGGRAVISLKGTPNSPSGTTRVPALAISSGAVLDLTNNSMVIDYTTLGTLLDDTRHHIVAGRLATAGSGTIGIGYGDNAVPLLNKTSFAGESVGTMTFLCKYTYLGDAQLDGQVDITDLGAMATRWQLSGVWTEGDFDYTNLVDITDLGLLATNWQAGVGAPLFGEPMSLYDALSLYPPLFEAAWADDYIRGLMEKGVDNSWAPSLGDVVPEPASLLSLIGVSIFTMRHRDRADRADRAERRYLPSRHAGA